MAARIDIRRVKTRRSHTRALPARWAVLATILAVSGILVVAAAPTASASVTLSASPSTVIFGAIPGTTRAAAVTISDSGSTGATVNSVSLSAAGMPLTNAPSGISLGTDNCVGFQLAASSGNNCQVEVVFTPTSGAHESADVIVQTTGGTLDVLVNAWAHLPLSSAIESVMNCSPAGGFWRLDEPNGVPQGNDYSSCGNNSPADSNVAFPGQVGPPGTYGDFGTYFYNGPSYVETNNSASDPQNFTLGAWINTANYQYGQTVIGFGTSQNPMSSSKYDRLLYISTGGFLNLGIYNGSVVRAYTNNPLASNTWYFVAGVLSGGCTSSGGTIDVYIYNTAGSLVGSGSNGPSSSVCAQNYTGYWAIGQSNAGSWPNIGNAAMDGQIIDAFATGTALSGSQLQSIAESGGGDGLAAPSVSGGGAGVGFYANPGNVTGRMTFGLTNAGHTSTQGEIIVSNSNSPAPGSLDIGAVQLTGPDTSDFKITGDSCANTSLSSGGQCSVYVAFRPLVAGNFSAELSMFDNTPMGWTVIDLHGSTPNSYRAQVLSDMSGLPSGDGAYLPLNEQQGNVANDKTGGGNNGFVTNWVGTGYQMAPGNAPSCLTGDNAMAFDGGASGGNSYVGINHGNLGTQLIGSTSNGPSSLTVAAWFNVTYWDGGNYRIVANDHPSATTDGFDVYVNKSGGSVGFGMGFYGSSGRTHTTVTATLSSALSLGQWYLVVATYSGSSSGSSMALYLYNSSGSQIATNTGSQSSGSMYPGEYVPYIGRDPQYSGDYMAGEIADVGIWYAPSTGTAELSSSQVGTLATSATSCGVANPNASTLTFANQPVGTSSSNSSAGGGEQIAIFDNSGSQPFSVSSLSIEGQSASEFTIMADRCSGSVSAGSICFAEVAFVPTVPGPANARLVLETNGLGGGATIQLFGTASNPYTSSVTGQPPPPWPPGQAKGIWPLDELSGTTAYDISGNGYNGTFENSPSFGAAGAGGSGGVCTQDNTATTFTGSSTQYVDIPGLNGSITYPVITVESWFMLTGDLSDYARLMSNGFPQGGSTYGGFELGLDPAANGGAAGGVFLNIRTSNGFQGPNNSGLDLSTGIWYDLVGVYNGSQVLVYLNGTLEASAPLTGSVMQSDSDLLLAAGNDEGGSPNVANASGSWFTGKIGYAGIFDSALTSSQVLAHYNYISKAGASCGFWALNDPATGRTAYDTSIWSTPTSYPSPSPYSPSTHYANNGILKGIVASGQPITGSGAPVCLPGNTADLFDGGWIETTRYFDNPQSFTIAAWFKTSTAGGGIIGFGNIASGAHDRALYVGTNGDLYFGVWSTSTNSADVAASGFRVDNGEWTLAVASFSSSMGPQLYVFNPSNGVSASSGASGYAAQNYSGNWWIGFFAGGGVWPYAGSMAFNGEIADASVQSGTIPSGSESDAYYWYDQPASSCAVASPSSTQLFFPNQPVGSQSAAQSITITNTGTQTLSFPASPVSIGGTDMADFVITGDTCAGASISVGSTCSVSVGFSPTMTGGRSAVLHISPSNSAGGPITVSLFGAVQVPYTAEVMNGGGSGTAPYGYWRLDEPPGYASAFDSSGNGHTASYGGTYILGQTPSFMACDPADTAVSLNGISGGVTTPITGFSPGAAMTVEGWVNISAWTGDNPRVVANGHADATGNGFELYISNGGGSGRFQSGYNYAQWSGTMNTNQWYFYVGTVNSTVNSVAAYLFTGSSTTPAVSATSTASGNVASDSHPIAIGYNPSYLGDFLDGEVAQVAVYSSALSLSEIEAQYSAAISCAQPSVSPNTLDFPDQKLFATSGSQSVTVANASGALQSFSITSVSINGLVSLGYQNFAVSSDSCAGTSVTAGSSCTIGIDFTPTLYDQGTYVNGSDREAILFITGATESGAASVTYEVTLEGTITTPENTSVCSGGATGASSGSTSCKGTTTSGGAGAPIAYWPMNETTGTLAHDASGNGHTGYLHDVTLGQPGSQVSSPAQTSMGFNGTSSYIDVPSLNNNLTPASLTVAGWIDPTGWTGNSRIVSNNWTDGGCGPPSCEAGFELVINGGGQSGFFAVGPDNTSYVQVNWSLSSPLALNTWYYYVGTYSGASKGTINAYLYEEGNTSPLVSASATGGYGNVYPSPYDVTIGRNPVYQGDYFMGNIDQVAIYGTQLSSSQIDTEFLAGQSTFAVSLPSSITWSANLNGYNESVDNGSGIDVQDLTGTGYGWSIGIAATPFYDPSSGRTLTNSFQVNGSSSSPTSTTAPTATSVSCPSGQTCNAPSDSVSYPVTIPESSGYGVPDGTVTNIYDANPGTGQGSWDLGTNWWITIPANSYAGAYSSTFVFDIATGP